MSETNRIEYKAKLSKALDLEKEVVAFLNYHEGGFPLTGNNWHDRTSYRTSRSAY